MKMYKVGGCVRDEILGVPSKDIDFTVVMEPVEGDPFRAMVNRLKIKGFRVFLETPEFLTVRAQFPIRSVNDLDSMDEDGNVIKAQRLTADFVLARKESDYTDGRRPDKVQVGTLHDDLARRDFTMNAIAQDENGVFIDPFNGRQDIDDEVIRAVGVAFDRLSEDALRAVRALRFSVTKGFRIDKELQIAMQSKPVLDSIRYIISDERISDEASKMFRFDTVASLAAFNQFPALMSAMFSGRVSLDSTLKTKGRGGKGKISNPAPTTTIKCFGR